MTKLYPIQHTADYRPEDVGYAPQIVLTLDTPRGWNDTELNADYLPFTATQFREVYEELAYRYRDFGTAENMVARWARVLGCTEVSWQVTRGYSQGDYGISFVFSTDKWLEDTGAVSLRGTDHADLCSWIWGDVYEYMEDGEEHSSIVYGMEAAQRIGEIVF